MKEAGLARSTSPAGLIQLDAPFSNFAYVEEHFQGEAAIRRLFSQARSHRARTLISEDIRAEGVLLSEKKEILRAYADYQLTGLKRLAFSRRRITSPDQIRTLGSRDLIGYFIAKRDCVRSIGKNDWHVFESVFRKYRHEHNCVPRQVLYPFRIGGKYFELEGVVYGQQNELNKACAQVAIRSICSLHLPLG